MTVTGVTPATFAVTVTGQSSFTLPYQLAASDCHLGYPSTPEPGDSHWPGSAGVVSVGRSQ
uniref:Uncharacterized protein n=1 Tax=uncultured bacterium A1Q1_fos_1880 TaxID=1256556 RepID=L7VZC7_9BACT|nr:hypothetical protein [uncultured bacterium A1Q1_fos_1880]